MKCPRCESVHFFPKYYVCKIEDIGLKRNEFLEKIVQVMESEGFRLSQGWEWFRNQMKNETLDNDIVLVSNEGEVGLRAKAFSNDLRVSYRCDSKIYRLRGVKKWLFDLVGISLLGLIFLGMFLTEFDPLYNFFCSFLGEWGTVALSIVIVLLVFIIPRVPVLKKDPLQNKTEKLIKEVAKSFRGKPKYFREKILELEDFLLPNEILYYQDTGKLQEIRIGYVICFDFYLTNERILLLGAPCDSQKTEVITERIQDITAINYIEEGPIVKRGVLTIESKTKKIGPLEGRPLDIEDILRQLQRHPLISNNVHDAIARVLLETFLRVTYKTELPSEVESTKEMTTDNLYENLLDRYTFIHGGGSRQLVENKIKSLMKEGLTREEAIYKLAEREKLT